MRLLLLFLPFLAEAQPSSSPTDGPTLSPTVQGGFQQLQPLPACGDGTCWCVKDPNCRDEQVGFTAYFPDFVSDLYATFVLTNPIPLQAPNGSQDCFPFQDAVGGRVTYPEAVGKPQCQGPAESDGFCAFVFEDSNAGFSNADACKGRRYSLQTFSTVEEIPSNASLTHQGPCGVCSSAQDLSTRMKTRDTLQTLGVLCGTRYFVAGIKGEAFAALIQCYLDEGFTVGCATLWAHFVATNAQLCPELCLGQEPPFNLGPDCHLTDCLNCSETQFSPAFDWIAGRNQQKSGITENIGRNCTEFYPVVHDPCPGQTAPPTMAPTPGPTGSGARHYVLSFMWMLVALVVTSYSWSA